MAKSLCLRAAAKASLQPSDESGGLLAVLRDAGDEDQDKHDGRDGGHGELSDAELLGRLDRGSDQAAGPQRHGYAEAHVRGRSELSVDEMPVHLRVGGGAESMDTSLLPLCMLAAAQTSPLARGVRPAQRVVWVDVQHGRPVHGVRLHVGQGDVCGAERVRRRHHA